jgi:hypothetical protein
VSHPFRVLTCPPSVGRARGHPLHSFRLNGRSLALSQRCVDPMPSLVALLMQWPFTLAPPSCSTIRPGTQRLGCCSGGFISPASRSDAKNDLGIASAAPMTGNALLIHACQRLGVRLPSHLCRPLHLCQACALIRPSAQPTCRLVQRLRRGRHCRPRTPSLCCHHTSPSHRPAWAMRHLASLSPVLALSP